MTQRLQIARSLFEEYAERLVCRLLGVNRSSVRHIGVPQTDEPHLEESILELKTTFPNAGVRYMYELLRRHSISCSRRQVRDVYLKHRLLQKRIRGRPQSTNSRHSHPVYPNLIKGFEITRADQVWCSDVTVIRIGKSWAYLDLILDVFTRRILGWSLSHTNDSLLCCAALYKALANGTPQIHHSDQGRPYASERYTRILKGARIKISMAKTASPWENGFVERLNKTLKDEETFLNEYRTLEEARTEIGSWIELYNHGRIHSSLDFYTPMEFFQMHETQPQSR